MKTLILAFLMVVPSWAGYGYKRALTIDHTKVGSSSHTDFTVLFSGTYSWLATTANGGRLANASGYDVDFFSDSGLTTALSWERERHVLATGEVVFWVKVPSVAHTVDTVIYIAMGDSSISTDQADGSAAWTAGFQGVWHLPNGSTLTALDSTSNGKNGTVTGATAATGQVDGGASFAGGSSTNRITTATMAPPTTRTWSAWFKVTAIDSTARRLWEFGAVRDQVFLDSTNLMQFQVGWTNVAAWRIATPSTASWHYLVITYNGSSTANDPLIYLDGVLQTVTEMTAPSGTLTTAAAVVTFGNRTANDRAWNGQIDEIRLSNTISSSDRVAAEYNNQVNPATFYAVGAETAVGTSRKRFVLIAQSGARQ